MNALVLFFSCILITVSHSTFCTQIRDARTSTRNQTSTSLAQPLKAKCVRFQRNPEHQAMLALLISCNRCDKSFEICCTCSRLFQMVDGETLIATHRHRLPRRAHSALPQSPICDGKTCPICDKKFDSMEKFILHVQGDNHSSPAHPKEWAFYKQTLIRQHQKHCAALATH